MPIVDMDESEDQPEQNQPNMDVSNIEMDTTNVEEDPLVDAPNVETEPIYDTDATNDEMNPLVEEMQSEETQPPTEYQIPEDLREVPSHPLSNVIGD